MDEVKRRWSVRLDGRPPADLERASKLVGVLPSFTPERRRALIAELMRLRVDLRSLVSSEPWFDHCWATGESFPPLAETSPMRACPCERCRRTGKVWPNGYVAPGHQRAAANTDGDDEDAQATPRDAVLSYECYLESLSDWEAANLPSSPSGLALRAIREGRIKVRFRRTRTRTR